MVNAQKRALSGGGRGIRTPGDLHPKAFQERPQLWLGSALVGLDWRFEFGLSPESARIGWLRPEIMAVVMAVGAGIVGLLVPLAAV